MTAEGSHEIGRVGVMRVKQFLESTTHLQMPWTAYDHENTCKLQRLDGTKKLYDLRGYFLGEKRRPLFVESKKYTTAGSQGTLYREYLADVYSITAKAQQEEMDEGAEFMWITWHPFSIGEWSNLVDHKYIRSAVIAHPDAAGMTLGDDPNQFVNEDICRIVAERLWVIVLSDRQHDLVMTPEEIRMTHASLARGGV